MITKEKKHSIVEKFGKTPRNTGDTGVQIALLTERIKWLTGHLPVYSRGVGTMPTPRDAAPCSRSGLFAACCVSCYWFACANWHCGIPPASPESRRVRWSERPSNNQAIADRGFRR